MTYVPNRNTRMQTIMLYNVRKYYVSMAMELPFAIWAFVSFSRWLPHQATCNKPAVYTFVMLGSLYLVSSGAPTVFVSANSPLVSFNLRPSSIHHRIA